MDQRRSPQSSRRGANAAPRKRRSALGRGRRSGNAVRFGRALLIRRLRGSVSVGFRRPMAESAVEPEGGRHCAMLGRRWVGGVVLETLCDSEGRF